MTKIQYKIPEPTIRRLATYLKLLITWKEKNVIRATSTMIAQELNIDPTQVRKDIQFTGISGKPKMGFEVTDLIEEIRYQLGWDQKLKAYIIGVGSLGKALLGYHGFRKMGIEFAGAFDNDPTKIGKKLFNIEIQQLNKLEKAVIGVDRKIGILAVPAISAQKTAKYLVETGFTAIWNFSPLPLDFGEDVVIENVQFTESLALLTYKMNKEHQENSIN